MNLFPKLPFSFSPETKRIFSFNFTFISISFPNFKYTLKILDSACEIIVASVLVIRYLYYFYMLMTLTIVDRDGFSKITKQIEEAISKKNIQNKRKN